MGLALLLVLAACAPKDDASGQTPALGSPLSPLPVPGNATSPVSTPASAGSNPSPLSPPALVPETAVNFALPQGTGGTVELSNHLDRGPVVLVFFQRIGG